MVGTRVWIKGALLFLLALVIFPASAQAAWPSIPTDDEINEAATRFIQDSFSESELEDCDAIADPTERNVCWTKRSMGAWFGPQITYRTEIVEASFLKIHHTSLTDPLIANAVVLLFTQKNWQESLQGERSTALTYDTAVLEYGSPQSEKPGWHFVGSRWWDYDLADLDQSLEPRELRDARVELLFRPRNDQGMYGWARGFLQNLSVIGYNGETDPTRMPMTFWIKLEDAGKPARGTPIPFEVGGDVKCLADRYAVWDSGAGSWAEQVHNFAAGPVRASNAPLTGADGMVIVRLFLDYGRMRLFNLQLPCTLEFTAYAPNADDEQTYQKAETTLEVASPAFVRSALYQAVTREGAATRRQLFNLAQLREWYAPLTPGEDKFGLNPTPMLEEPTKARVLSRISVDGRQLAPPEGSYDYFLPIKPGGQLIVDASSQPLDVPGEGSGRTWAPRPGDGIGVAVMWLDGSTGLFLVNNRTPELNSVLAMRVVGSWATTQGMPLSDDGGLALFVVGQGVDWVVQKAIVGGATALGGPVAGAWAAVIVGGAQAVNDIGELGDLVQRNRRVIWLRSLVALTSDVDGRNTLYVAEGSPGVEDGAAGEVTVEAGQAVEFALEGEISPPSAQEPSPLAQAMLDALPAIDAPYAVSGEEAANAEAAQTQAADDAGWLSEDLSGDFLKDLPAGWEDELGGIDWGVAAGVGAVTMVIVVVWGLARRGKKRRGRKRRAATVNTKDSAYAIQPASPQTDKKAPSAPRRTQTDSATAPIAPAAKPRGRKAAAPEASPEKANTPAPSAVYACPRCGKPIRAGARFCSYCGAKAEPPAEVAPPAEPRCPNCQAPVRPGARFCGACGHELDA